MPYVDRDKQNKITGMYAIKQYDGQEYILDNSPEALEGVHKPKDMARTEKYNERGADFGSMVVALWEMVVEGKPGMASSIQSKRQQVKSEIP